MENTAARPSPRACGRGQLIVLESTTYPGTDGRGACKPILEATGLKSGEDFFLAFSPEREDPGNPDFGTVDASRRWSAATGRDALRLADALYGQLVVRTVPVSSDGDRRGREAHREHLPAVNIALVNELKVVYDAMGIDVWEVIDAAKTKPFGFMPFYPGPGLGGHCIPIDPFYLTWKAREYDITDPLHRARGRDQHPDALLRGGQARRGDRPQRAGPFAGSRILLLGIAYKKNVDDMRESPSLKLIELIEAARRGRATITILTFR